MDITEAEGVLAPEPGTHTERWPGGTRWLVPAGVLVLVLSIWPLGAYASRYLYVETIQFFTVAVVVPALIVRGASWMPRWGRVPLGAALGIDAVFAACCLLWRLPPVLDALARQPLLRVPELASALLLGTAVWLQLVGTPPAAIRLNRVQRAAVAAPAMWAVWAIAFAYGFAIRPVIHAYDLSGSLGAVADQELSSAVMWVMTGAAFIPVIAVTMLTWLHDSAGPSPADERQPARGAAGVRGWSRAPHSS